MNELGNPDRPIGGLAVRPPAGVELRPLGRADHAAAVQLAREGRGVLLLDDPGPLRERFEAMVADPDVLPYGAVADGELCGLAVARLRRRLNTATREGWLSDLAVRAIDRGRGIGLALVRAVIADWRLRGGHRLQATVPNGAEAAHATMLRAGMEEWLGALRIRPIVAPDERPVPEGVRLRALRDGDGEPVTRLIGEFTSRRATSPDRVAAVGRTFHDHAERVARGEAASSVAELDGEVVGVCTLEWQEPFWTDELHAWLPELVVTERVRGRGIGRALLGRALSLAAERGAGELHLESGEQRIAARKLYAAAGFEEWGRCYLLQRDD